MFSAGIRLLESLFHISSLLSLSLCWSPAFSHLLVQFVSAWALVSSNFSLSCLSIDSSRRGWEKTFQYLHELQASRGRSGCIEGHLLHSAETTNKPTIKKRREKILRSGIYCLCSPHTLQAALSWGTASAQDSIFKSSLFVVVEEISARHYIYRTHRDDVRWFCFL